jgi:hypothetical protein
VTEHRAPASVPEIVEPHGGPVRAAAEPDVTVLQAAAIADVGPSTIRRRLSEAGHPDLPHAYKDDSGRWLIPLHDLRAVFAVAASTPGTPAAPGLRSRSGADRSAADGELTDARRRVEVAEATAAEARRELADRLADKDAQIAQIRADKEALLRRTDQALSAKDEAIIAKDDTVTALVGALADRDDRILTLERELQVLSRGPKGGGPTGAYVRGTVVNGGKPKRGRSKAGKPKAPRRSLWEWLIGIEGPR